MEQPVQNYENTWTLKEAIEMTFLQCWQNTADRAGHEMKTKQLLEFFGATTPLTAITTEWVLRFRQWCAKEYNNKHTTINRKVCALSKVLHTALEHDKMARVPKMPLVREDNARMRFMTLEEEKETLECFQTYTSQDHTDAFLVLLDTGFRTGELWTIRRNQVNFIQKTIFLKDGETKNRSGRTVFMTERVAKILQWRLEANPKAEYVFPYKNSWFATGWNKVRKVLGKTGEADWVPHMLRHTCCSRLVQAQVDLFLVQRWMGHKDLSITQRYAHHAPDSIRMAGERLERLTKGLL